jgi:hypothetical protein
MRVGREFTLAVKLNSADFQRGGFDEGDALEVVRLLEREGIDLLEISGGSYEQPTWFGDNDVSGAAPRAASTAAREAYFLEFARKVRGVSKLPLMVTGGFRSRVGMEEALKEGAVDIIGLARPLVLEPDLPVRILSWQAERAGPMPKLLRIRALAALGEASFFWRQMLRLANGRAPSPSMGIVFSILLYVMRDAIRASLHRMVWRTKSARGTPPRSHESSKRVDWGSFETRP